MANSADSYAIYPFPLGRLKIGYDKDVVTSLGRTDTADEGGLKTALTDLAYTQIMEYFQGMRRTFTFPYELRGTDFQKKVWHALCDIPYGETRTYKEIAAAVGNPKACRAVGMANNKNPIAIAVPCHRVIGADGKLVGYAGGLDMKETLLQLEKKCLSPFLSHAVRDDLSQPLKPFFRKFSRTAKLCRSV